YLAGGLAIGPFGLGVFTHPGSILQVAELGVVMFLFIIGLEMRPTRLWGMRREIFGLGLLQVVACALLLGGVGVATGYPVVASFVSGAGFVLTSTAIVMQLLEERRELDSSGGQRIVSILLLEDLMIVPLLALVAFLAPIAPGNPQRGGIDWQAIAIGVGAIAGLLIAGRYLLNPLFGLLANARAREVMTAAALLVVLGSAYAMELGGLSMAMGAFLAGVLLSESTYRHQLEVDVEPFRGILLGLFFLAVGMSLDLGVVAANWRLVLFYVAAYMLVKGAGIYLVARLLRSSNREAVDRAILMAQGGEFAFVLYAAAASVGILTAEENATLTAIIILSMVLTPVAIAALDFLRRGVQPSAEGYERPEGLKAAALIIGFGRVGQIASQFLLARGCEISIIDTDVEMIDVAREYGFKVHYGDGTRLDILHAAGAGQARVVLVCVDKAEDATRMTELLKAQFPGVPVLVRAVDRRHSLNLIRAGADLQVRETFESAVVLGEAALAKLGVESTEVEQISVRLRARDEQRLQLELVGGPGAGKALFSGKPEPQEAPVVDRRPPG
ncbi:MAG: cation:proton antiporter, partial [Burkholderiales bacterium]|nr:cation:proton antiporter [Burkholderiales bacterium]